MLAADGTLCPARTPITARQLLTHTSGFGYTIWNERLAAHVREHPLPAAAVPGAEILGAPLLFEPGTTWQYSISTDWIGELISAISGQRLGQYFAEHLFRPLGMTATRFFDAAGGAEVASLHARQVDGSLAREVALPRRGGGGTPTSRAAEDCSRRPVTTGAFCE